MMGEVALPRSSAMLSEHLSLHEMTRTRHRQYLAEQADPPEMVLGNLQRFAAIIYEPARDLCGPFHVNSGWRCPGLNRTVGGRPNSAHLIGNAGDLDPLEIDLYTAYQRLMASDVPFDELLWEYGQWIHIQAAPRGHDPRRLRLMTFDGHHFEPFDPSDPRVVRIM